MVAHIDEEAPAAHPSRTVGERTSVESWLSAVFFIVALLAVAAATAGPVYLAAAKQSVLAHVVVPATAESTGLVVNEQAGQPVSEARFEHALATQVDLRAA